MKIERIVYAANARLPTEKAHGYQICKMCEAFARTGLQVTLMHPARHHVESATRGRSVFDYYEIDPIFRVQVLPNWDVVRLNSLIPDRFFAPFFFIHAFLYGLYAALMARRAKADLYYTRESTLAYWLCRFGLPTALEVHVIPKRGQRWLLQTMPKNSSLRLVVTLANSMRRSLFRFGFPSERMLGLPHGVDLAHFENLPSKEACRGQLGLPFAQPIVGYVGRFHAVGMDKGIPHLIEAMSHLRLDDSGQTLLVCVGGPMEGIPGYEDCAKRVGMPAQRIRFVDRVPNRKVPVWLRACDALTLPITAEYAESIGAMPLKLFEYMAAGVPIISSDLPALREVLRHGENAWLTEPGNPKSLAEGLRSVIGQRELASRLSMRAREDVKQYTWAGRARKIIDFLQNEPLEDTDK